MPNTIRFYTSFTQIKNDLDGDLDHNLDCNPDRDPKDVPDYMGHSLLNTTKCITLLFIVQLLSQCITLLFIVQSSSHQNLPNIWIKIIQIVIQIECLHGTTFLDLVHDPDNFAPYKQGISLLKATYRWPNVRRCGPLCPCYWCRLLAGAGTPAWGCCRIWRPAAGGCTPHCLWY